MELVQLKIVKEIHEAGSLSKASMRLGKAQSIVSRHLSAFEKECGGRIFHRNGRGVQLTELGEEVLPRIEAILASTEELAGAGRAQGGELAGPVRVNVSSALCDWLVPRLYKTLQEEHPQIRLQFFEGYSNAIDDALEACTTDVAIYLSNGTAVGSCHEPIRQYDTYLIGQPGAPFTGRQEILFSELDGLPLLLPSEPSLARHAISELASSRGITLNIAAEVNSPASTQALFDAGVGYLVAAVACGPAAETGHIGREIASGRLQAARIVDPDLKRLLVVGTPPGASRRAEEVRRVAVRLLREADHPANDLRLRTVGG